MCARMETLAVDTLTSDRVGRYEVTAMESGRCDCVEEVDAFLREMGWDVESIAFVDDNMGRKEPLPVVISLRQLFTEVYTYVSVMETVLVWTVHL